MDPDYLKYTQKNYVKKHDAEVHLEEKKAQQKQLKRNASDWQGKKISSQNDDATSNVVKNFFKRQQQTSK